MFDVMFGIQFVILFLIFQLKHFVCDWLLDINEQYVRALFNSVGTLAIVLYVNPSLWWIGVADLALRISIPKIFIGNRIRLGMAQSLYSILDISLVFILMVK